MNQTDNTRTAEQASNGRIREGLDSARESASHASARAAETIDASPLAVLAGGLAVGALAGALIPRSGRERELLRPVGAKLGATAAAALAAAKETGRSEMEQRGLTKDSAREQAKSLLDNVAKAATGAATAAAQSAKQEATGSSDQSVSAGAEDKVEPTGSTGAFGSAGVTGENVPPTDPHRQVMAGDRETSFNSGV